MIQVPVTLGIIEVDGDGNEIARYTAEEWAIKKLTVQLDRIEKKLDQLLSVASRGT